MMNTEIKILCIIGICFIVSLLLNLINLKRKNRKYQLSLPIISALYGVIATLVLMIYKDDIFDYFNKLGLQEGETLQQIHHFYTIDELVNTDIALFNIAVLISYFFVKLLALIIIKIYSVKSAKKKDNDDNKVYYYDNDNYVWLLKDEWVNFRDLLKWMTLGIVVFSTIFLSLTCYFGNEHDLWIYIFVAIPQIVMIEILNYFNGYTKEEFFHDVYGIDSFSKNVNNFHKLRDLYEKLFPNELLVATTSNEHTNRESGNEVIENLKKSSNSLHRITGEFFDNNDKNHYEVDSLLASVDLVDNKNVVFFNPFYRDLSDYIILPLINALLSSGKCLIILGRNSVSKDVKQWIKELIKEYTRMESLWRIDNLTYKNPECEIGLLNSSALYDLNVLKTNYNFFSKVKFIIFIEPSRIINTSQIALSIISQKINQDGNKANFCVFDKPTDGLVDTLSHVMKEEIINVVAPPIPDGAYTAMAWNADGDYLRQNLFEKQTKFFGNGIELAAVALKNQIPKVTWFSESEAPIRDIKWIASQHYPTLCKYMNLPSQQKNLSEKIKFESSLWSASREKDNFIIAEDEFNNFYITLRAFLSRGISQSFVNVLSENYLLRDYMRCNTRMFLSNPNSIPSLVPDYSKTERNLIIKLLLMMSIQELEETEIIKELQLINIHCDNVPLELHKLITKYTQASDQILNIRSEDNEIGEVDANTFYSLSKELFDKYFSNSLHTAYYIVEDEKEQLEYIDSKLYGQIVQSILPDQFITYDGKYYKVKYISSDRGVILRRASDLYNGNEYYRQIRHYRINAINNIISAKTIIDMEFSLIQCDFEVETSGFLQLTSNNDLRNAKIIKFGLESEMERFKRTYQNKNILKIKLPDTDDKIRFTLAIFLSEVFKSVYPSSWQYLAVVSAIPDDVDGMLNYMLYSIDLDIEDDYIYIIEDSYMDLGLLSSIEKNIFRFFEIIADFLDWHEDKMREHNYEDPIPKGINFDSEQKAEKKRFLLSNMLKRIRTLFMKEKDENVEVDFSQENVIKDSDNNSVQSNEQETEQRDFSLEENSDNQDALSEIENAENGNDFSLEDTVENDVDNSKSENGFEKTYNRLEIVEEDFIPSDDENPELASIDGTDIFDHDGLKDDYIIDFNKLGFMPIEKTRYQKECYLKFGFDEIDSRLKLDDLKRYLRVHGWSDNSLTKARKRDILAKQLIDFNVENHCDFCGLPLTGVSYDRLGDGRIRCNDCSKSTISTVEQFKELFYQVLDMMENFYGINYKFPIIVEMADARTIAKKMGMLFKPSTDFAERVLGFAKLHKGKYSLIIENGSPKLAAIDTMVHEMTHIWQYINWKSSGVSSIYEMPNKLCPAKSKCDQLAVLAVYEGMAMWASIQYLYQMGEIYYASQQEAVAESRTDIYGIGFRLYKAKYPIVKDAALLKYTPFLEFPTVEPSEIIEEIKKLCKRKDFNC